MVQSGEKWGIIMLMGEYLHNLDEKKRLIIPSKFRSELGERLVITRGLENCLFLYSEVDFRKIVDKLKMIPFTKKEARGFMRFFLSGATVVEFDKQGRITIPTTLITYSNIDKECVIIGTGDRLEVWSRDSWDDVYNSTKDNMSEIAENLFDTNII